MAPKAKAKKEQCDPHGMFAGMVVFFVPKGVQPRRLQVQTQTLFILKTPPFFFATSTHLQFQSLYLFLKFLSFFLLCKIWKQRLVKMGGVIEDRLSKWVTHVFALDSHSLLHQLDTHRLSRFKGVGFSNF